MLFKDIFKSWRFCHKNYEGLRFKTSCINQYGFMHNCVGNGMLKWKKSYRMHFVLQKDFFRLNKQSYVGGREQKCKQTLELNTKRNPVDAVMLNFKLLCPMCLDQWFSNFLKSDCTWNNNNFRCTIYKFWKNVIIKSNIAEKK